MRPEPRPRPRARSLWSGAALLLLGALAGGGVTGLVAHQRDAGRVETQLRDLDSRIHERDEAGIAEIAHSAPFAHTLATRPDAPSIGVSNVRVAGEATTMYIATLTSAQDPSFRTEVFVARPPVSGFGAVLDPHGGYEITPMQP